MTIRDAAETDVPALAALEALCFSVPLTEEQLRHQLPDDRHVLLLAEENGRPAGYAGMLHVLDEGDIGSVAVLPALRRRGVASALLAALLERAAALGLAFVTLEVRASNAAAAALYRKHGFRQVGLRRNYYERPQEDAVLMTCFLDRGEGI